MRVLPESRPRGTARSTPPVPQLHSMSDALTAQLFESKLRPRTSGTDPSFIASAKTTSRFPSGRCRRLLSRRGSLRSSKHTCPASTPPFNTSKPCETKQHSSAGHCSTQRSPVHSPATTHPLANSPTAGGSPRFPTFSTTSASADSLLVSTMHTGQGVPHLRPYEHQPNRGLVFDAVKFSGWTSPSGGSRRGDVLFNQQQQPCADRQDRARRYRSRARVLQSHDRASGSMRLRLLAPFLEHPAPRHVR